MVEANIEERNTERAQARNPRSSKKMIQWGRGSWQITSP